MKIEDMQVKETEQKTKDTDKGKITTHKVVLVPENKESRTKKIQIESFDPIGYAQGEKGITVEFKNTQTKLDVDMPKKD